MKTIEQRPYYHRRLNYGPITLVPVQDGNESYPFNEAKYKDAWHVPGRTMYTTAQLVDLANSKDITVTMTECTGAGRSTYRLN